MADRNADRNADRTADDRTPDRGTGGSAGTGRTDESRRDRRMDPDDATMNYRAGGPSPNETDREVRRGGRSEWLTDGAPGAGDPAAEITDRGMDLLGRESLRDDAIPGVSGIDGMDDRDLGPDRNARRRSPPPLDDVNNAAGDVSETGGVAGGFRGSAGRSDAGAGDPYDESRTGPAEYKASSRFDLDHPGSEVGEDEADGTDDER